MLNGLSNCTACTLRQGCSRPVPGVGPADLSAVRVMLVGESPGEHEDKKGIPFTGNAGRELDVLLQQFSYLTRWEIYITNLVKCFPFKGREPARREIDTCTGNWLNEEVFRIRPDGIIAAGRTAARYLLGDPTVDMDREHGIPRRGGVFKNWWNGWIVPSYHPASGLHEPYNFRWAQEDFAVVHKLLNGTYRAPVDEHPTTRYQLFRTGEDTLHV